MILFPFLQALGFSPSLATKPASALFLLSLLISFFPRFENPTWLYGATPAVILFVIALAEWQIGKDTIFMDVFDFIMPAIKIVLAVAITLAMLDTDVELILNYLFNEDTVLTTAVSWGQIGIKSVYSLFVGVVTFYSTIYFNSYRRFISQFDEDNDMGLVTLYSFGEFTFALSNGALALFFPVAAILLFIATLIGLRLMRLYLEKQEASKMVACTNACGTMIYGSALECPSCGTQNPKPKQVGLLGQTRQQPISSRSEHQWDLLAQKRCPRCATPFSGRTMHQMCVGCETAVLDSPVAVKKYVAHFEQKLVPTMIFCALVGWIPFLGLFAGVVYYRLNLVSPMRRYVPSLQGCMGRWGLRLVNLVLASFQAIPFAGSILLPLMCYLNFQVYKSLMLRSQTPSDPPPKPRKRLA